LSRWDADHKRISSRRFDVWRRKSRIRSVQCRQCIRVASLFCFCIAIVAGCSRPVAPAPTIEFTRVPPAVEGGSDTLDVIEGRAKGADPDSQIVLYVRTSKWWVQPLVDQPFTELRPDSAWTNSTHLGTDYAALLVKSGFHPAPALDELPAPSGDIVAAARVRGSAPAMAVTKTLSFSGYEWRIRTAPSDRGGKNDYDASNAWTDGSGALHLRLAKRGNDWTSSEVALTRNLGYGTYSFAVREATQLDPAAVFSVFTYDYAGNDPNHREMDIEVSRWGDPGIENAQYVLQPFYVPENVSRFQAPAGVLTYSFHWEPGRITFATAQGTISDRSARLVGQHVFTSGVPTPGAESVRLSVYVFRAAKQTLQKGGEVVVEKFEYLP